MAPQHEKQISRQQNNTINNTSTDTINANNNKNALTIIQANLTRSFKASQSLRNLNDEKKHDISVIPEPHVSNNKIIGFAHIHKIIAHNKNPKTAVIIHNEKIAVFPILIEEKVIAIVVTNDNNKYLIINCYSPPQESISYILSKIENVIQGVAHNKLIILGDFNAKNKIWGSKTCDEKGEDLLEFIIRHDLVLLNDKNSSPTFKTARAKGWIDLTIVNQELKEDVLNWQVLKHFNNSDHRYIYTNISKLETQPEYGLTLKGRTKLLEDIKHDLWFSEIQDKITNKNDIEKTVKQFYNKIETLFKKYEKK